MTVVSHDGVGPRSGARRTPPRAAARAAVARTLFLRSVRRLAPAGRRCPTAPCAARGSPGAPVMTIARDAFFHRLAAAGKIGFGEAYMAGDWAADDLAAALAAFAGRVDRLLPRAASAPAAACTSRGMPAEQRNTPHGRGAQHLAATTTCRTTSSPLFLDPTMTYSARRVRAGRHARGGPDAQVRDALPAWSTCGRPTTCSRSAPAGADSPSTPPPPAAAGSRPRPSRRPRRCSPASASPRPAWPIASRSSCATTATSRARYSKIVSIEMLEAVGEEYWPVFFATCDRLLAAGRLDGPADDHDAASPLPGVTARLRLDPQVHLPGRADPVARGDRPVAARRARRCGVTHAAEIGHHYATTLRHWRDALPGPARAGARRSASTTRSCACGSSIWPTARPDSRPARSETSQLRLARP